MLTASASILLFFWGEVATIPKPLAPLMAIHWWAILCGAVLVELAGWLHRKFYG